MTLQKLFHIQDNQEPGLEEKFSANGRILSANGMRQSEMFRNFATGMRRMETEKEQEKIAEEIVSRKYEPQIKYDAFAKVYETTNTSSMVVAKIIAKELKHAYGLQPQNRDVIVEQMRGLLDGEMPKVVFRADVCDFYDSIPQEPLLQRIVADGKLTSYSMKYLRSFFYQYNMYRPEDEELIGIPKGLSFLVMNTSI